MKKSLIILYMLLDVCLLQAQNHQFNYEDAFAPFEIVRKDRAEGKPYRAVQFLSRLDTSSLKDLDIYGQALMTALCFTGEIERKENVCQKFRTLHKGLDRPERMDTSLRRAEAADIIMDRAKSSEVVILNEAHLYPQHRVFAKSLLAGLYALGYKHLCMEDLQESARLESMKIPERSKGYYIQEPCMGDMVREALKLGFHLHAYDAPASPRRDSVAARNIQRIRASHPADKLVVYCGFSHAMEHRSPTCMASYFKKMTGIDPLTIDQTVYCEREASDYYSRLVQFYAIQSPSVLLAGDSIIPLHKAYCDIQVITPPTSYIKGRPHWLLELDGRQLKEIEDCFQGGIVEVYYADELTENKEAVPIDVWVVHAQDTRHRYLALPGEGAFICKYYQADYTYLYSVILP